MPTVQAGEKLARKFRDIAWRTHQRERVASALAPHRQPLGLNSLFPFPRHVLRKGFAAAGQESMWWNWESAGPIWRVEFATERRRHGRWGLKPVAVFRFLSEDWSPWVALARMRERWPRLNDVFFANLLETYPSEELRSRFPLEPRKAGYKVENRLLRKSRPWTPLSRVVRRRRRTAWLDRRRRRRLEARRYRPPREPIE
jgi:hypothetical protein